MYPINVLRIVPSMEIGGMERTLLSLLPRLDKNKYKVFVCCLYRKDVLAEEMEKLGIPVFCLNMKAKLDLNLKYLTGIVKLISLIRKNNIKIVHAHIYKASTPGRIAAILAGVPIVILHKHNLSFKENEIRMDRFLSKFTDKIIAVSESVRDSYIREVGVPQQKVTVIYNGIDIESFDKKVNVAKIRKELGIPSNYKVIGTVGRLKKVKGHIYFLKAAQIIKKEAKNIKFLIVGGGSLLKKLKEQCSRLGLMNDVIFTREQKDINKFLSIMDIFVLSSLSEGFGVSILEAMAETKPVVVTSVGGAPEIIKDGINGFLVPPRSENLMAEKVLSILNNKETASKIAQKARETVINKFTVEKMLEETESLYSNLINEKLNNV